MEGFAIYGASLHPTAAFPLQALLSAAKLRQPRLAGREPAAAVHERDRARASENSNVIELERAAPSDAGSARRWNWLASLGETMVALPAHWRREREIKRAVAALAELDDRTLQDLGIGGRSEIERVVRYCRDC
jgi:uncharacterized protein YjiS (DUF1127 family)